DGHACYISVCVRITKNGGAELRVDKDAALFLGEALRQRKLEGVVNDRLALDYYFSLFLCQRTFPSKQSFCERTAMIKWQNVERLVVSDRHRFLLTLHTGLSEPPPDLSQLPMSRSKFALAGFHEPADE